MLAADNDLTPVQWERVRSAWGGCAYCGATDTPLQRDCVQPISVGGRYTVGNVVPACRSCNTSKCNSEVTMWMRRKKLDERLFLERLSVIARTLADPAPDPTVAEPAITEPDVSDIDTEGCVSGTT
ncbi:hypothetical protein GS4_05_00920 [Gordonia soli NBRC 108243]|uniref:HNH nuclease domain-containing protein n=2 Tax=Gordonia soli TaxID=320799 RepID=M0QE80_9ACTN|nr:hypothetical protein GS4_05_00920 [Gordonia soli NBRC 108243]